jgi:methionyl-tRNA formyltransferase
VSRPRVALLGKGDLAVRVGAWFHESPAYDLALVVPVVPEPAWSGSLAAWAEEAGVPCHASGDYREVDDTFDLVFSVFYDRILSEEFIRAQRRVLNLHNGPLPRYRGVAPINWALKNEEHSHGVTIHEITPGIDDGPIVARLDYSIYPELDEVEDVYGRALAYGWTLFEQTMPIVDRIEPRAQNGAEATYYSSADRAGLGDRADWRR